MSDDTFLQSERTEAYCLTLTESIAARKFEKWENSWNAEASSYFSLICLLACRRGLN